jgi:hypothetical protein
MFARHKQTFLSCQHSGRCRELRFLDCLITDAYGPECLAQGYFSKPSAVSQKGISFGITLSEVIEASSTSSLAVRSSGFRQG